MKRILLAKLMLIGALLATNAQSKPYKGSYVSHLETEPAFDGTQRVGPHNIKLSISYEKTSTGTERGRYPVSYIRDSFNLSHREVLSVLRERGHTPADCKQTYSLHIFILSFNTMFHSNLFDKYEGHRIPNTSIYGLFDTTPEIWGESNILLAPHSRRIDFLTMHHEFSHYWYNRYCLSNLYPDTEEFARIMEVRTARRHYDQF